MLYLMFVALLARSALGDITDETYFVSHLAEKEMNLSLSSSGSTRSTWTWTAPTSFQVGSGARALTSSHPLDTEALVKAERLKPEPRVLSLTQSLVKAERPKPTTVIDCRTIAWFLLPVSLWSILIIMMPTGTTQNFNIGTRDFNYRIPPSWSPENESTYSFRAYMTDMSIWIMLTDLQPHQQCASIVMRLGGAAREMARMISPQEMMHGEI